MSDNVKKRKKVVKKNKKSWRIHSDTRDVDKFLEDERLEERLGAPFRKRTNANLFTIDSTPNNHLLRVDENKIAFRQSLRNTDPKCYAVLKPHTAVSDPILKRNRVRTPEERKNPVIRRLEEVKKTTGKLKRKERLAESNRKVASAARKKIPKRNEFNTDIWTTDPKNEVLTKIDTHWLSPDTIRHILTSKGITEKKTPMVVRKKIFTVPSIEVPHPGISYNPSYDDHQNLLREIAEKELKLIKEQKHLDRVTTKMFKKVLPKEKDENWLSEASEGLTLASNSNIKLECNNDEKTGTRSLSVKNMKKTKAQRRKQKEQKILTLQQKKAKIEKKKISDIYKLNLLNKQIAVKEHKIECSKKKRKIIKEKRATEPKMLSKTKFEPLEQEFNLGTEISGNLRGTKVVGNLLKDRYKSLQQRNILAPGKLVLKHSKPKVKKFMKADHKITLPKN